MIDFIIDWKPYETTIDGYPITLELRPLKAWAHILLLPYFLKMDELAENSKKIASETDEQKINDWVIKSSTLTVELQEICKKIFPDHVRNITGFTVNNKPIDTLIICEETMFGTLVMDIVGELAKRSRISGAEAKN